MQSSFPFGGTRRDNDPFPPLSETVVATVAGSSSHDKSGVGGSGFDGRVRLVGDPEFSFASEGTAGVATEEAAVVRGGGEGLQGMEGAGGMLMC